MSATYSPEDNKLRLYVGRVPRDEYERLRAEGWTSTPKQDCNFVATWNPQRRDTALEYGEGVIEDEDQPMAERAADRAERFGGYRDKRTDEATGHADHYDSGPSAHGFQNQARAERSAARHDRIADRAGDAWSKAEYWQSRTAGVIRHALYKSTPGVRMGRIKVLEAELRKHEAALQQCAALFHDMQKIAAMTDAESQNKVALQYLGSRNVWADYMHPRPETVTNPHIRENASSLYTLMTLTEREYGSSDITGAEACALFFSDHSGPAAEDDWSIHLKLRLAYENQMLEAQGGRAAHVEMEVGGFIGSYQIRKVNKSPATGRVVSVQVLEKTRASFDRHGKPYGADNPKPMTLHTLNIERLSKEVYRPPTAEDIAALQEAKAAEKASVPKVATIPLVNPTDADAERLVALWNEHRLENHKARNSYGGFKPCVVQRITQAVYSANSKGAHARAETRSICSLGRLDERNSFYDYSGQAQRKTERGPALCQVRTTGFDPVHVLILTDKPQKPLPAAVFQPLVAADNVQCSACNGSFPRKQWELNNESHLFGRAMVCPHCNMQHAVTKQARTADTINA